MDNNKIEQKTNSINIEEIAKNITGAIGIIYLLGFTVFNSYLFTNNINDLNIISINYLRAGIIYSFYAILIILSYIEIYNLYENKTLARLLAVIIILIINGLICEVVDPAEKIYIILICAILITNSFLSRIKNLIIFIINMELSF